MQNADGGTDVNREKRLRIEESLLDWVILDDMLWEVAELLDKAISNTLNPSFRLERVILYRNKNSTAQNVLNVFNAVREKLDNPEEQPINTREQVLKVRRSSMAGCCERYANN